MAGLLYSTSGNNATVTGFSSTAANSGYTSLTIPKTTMISLTESYTVVAIGNQAFTQNAQYFKSCTIEEGIKTIGAQAFGGMTKLETLTIPASVTTIGAQVFMGASSLKTVIMKGKTPPTISSFANSSGYKIIVPYGYLETYKTKWASYSAEVALLQEAAPGAGDEFTSGDFKYRVNDDGTTATIIGYTGDATELTLGGNVTCNGQSYKVTKTEGTLFTENNTLTTATIANGVTEIGYGLFEEAQALKTVNIPASVTTIGEHAFDWCQKLESVTIEKNSKLTTIDTEAFSGCKSLKKFIIPANVTNIGNEAFNGCSGLESVTIEENSKLTTIAYKAFGNCSALKEFTILTTTPPTLGDQGFDQLPSDCKIYVPSSAVETYKTAEGWSAYADRIHAAPLQVGDQFTAGNIKYQVESLDPTKTVSIIGTSTNQYSETIYPTVTFENEEYTITKVGDNAFKNTTIAYLETNTISEVGTNSFNWIYVPFGSGPDFKNSDVWSSYKDKIKEKEYNKGGLVYTNISDENTKKVCVDIEMLFSENSGGTVPQTITVNNVVYQVTKISSNYNTEIEYFPTITIPAGIEEIDDNAFQHAGSFAVPHTELSYYQEKWPNHASMFTIAYSDAKQLTDATAIAEAEGFYEAGTLTYKRTFDEAGQYATLCLPFETKLSDLTSAFEAVYLPQGNIIHYTGDDDPALSGKFILLLEKQEATGTIAAGQPFFVKTDAQEVTLKNVFETELKADAAPTATSMKVLDWDGRTGLMTSNKDIEVSYAGTYKTEEPNGRYTFNTDGSFGIQTEGSILPFRMQLTVTNNSISQNAPMLFSIGTGNGSTTGINQIIGSHTASAGKVYSIDGHLINTTGSTQGLTKGVYVKNGKKIIVK